MTHCVVFIRGPLLVFWSFCWRHSLPGLSARSPFGKNLTKSLQLKYVFLGSHFHRVLQFSKLSYQWQFNYYCKPWHMYVCVHKYTHIHLTTFLVYYLCSFETARSYGPLQENGNNLCYFLQNRLKMRWILFIIGVKWMLSESIYSIQYRKNCSISSAILQHRHPKASPTFFYFIHSFSMNLSST